MPLSLQVSCERGIFMGVSGFIRMEGIAAPMGPAWKQASALRLPCEDGNKNFQSYCAAKDTSGVDAGWF